MSKERFLKLIIMLMDKYSVKLNDLRIVKDCPEMLSLYENEKGITSLIEGDKQKVAVKYFEFSALLEELKHFE